jgi:haloalkane dehalogenase
MKRFVAMNTIFGFDPNTREDRLSPWFTMVKEMEDAGHFEAVFSNLRFLVGGIMRVIGLERLEVMTDTWLSAYAAPFSTAEESRAAIAWPLEGLHQERILETMIEAFGGLSQLGERGVAAMMIEGMQDHGIWPHVAISGFRAFFPQGTVHELEHAGHFIQEDAHEIIVPLIEEFCLRT